MSAWRHITGRIGAVATAWIVVLACTMLPSSDAAAQPVPGPLTTEGLNQRVEAAASVRAFGGVSIGSENAIGSMFANPGTLFSLSGPQISIAGARRTLDLRQVQHFAPVRYYPNLSLLLEGMTDQIPDPDPSLIGFTPADSVQRPFDDIPPRWSRGDDENLPLHALAAVPFSLGGIKIVAGAGFVRYADLHYYDQNNNALDPAVLSTRPLPTLRPTDDNPITVNWMKSIRSRDGVVHGYGAAIAGHVERYGLTLGISGLVLDGSSDDVEQVVHRGRLTFFANEFRAAPSMGSVVRRGSSDFSGFELTMSSLLNSEFVSVGVVVRPPTTFTRSFETAIETDTTGTPMTSSISGEDKFRLPWRGTAGLLLRPRDRLRIGLEYEWRPYGQARLTGTHGVQTTPWESVSVFRIGAQYAPIHWAVIRAGLQREADVFVPDGSPMDIEPVTYRVYSFGFGLRYLGIHWNVAYETARMSYEDIWASAFSSNTVRMQRISVDLAYTLPW